MTPPQLACGAIQATGAAETQRMRFDRVLVDAPCSGTGVLSKRADLRWQRGEDSIADLVKLQVLSILSTFDLCGACYARC
jgi:16S rRNA C967 or C1407 C5-methylase (RsmB/RsmF family)